MFTSLILHTAINNTRTALTIVALLGISFSYSAGQKMSVPKVLPNISIDKEGVFVENKGNKIMLFRFSPVIPSIISEGTFSEQQGEFNSTSTRST